MANDGGMVAKIEQWIAETLEALKHNDVLVFKTSESWMFQLASGAESFAAVQPFAYVSYSPADAEREGDFDLKQVLRFAVAIGVESNQPGVARIGDATTLGISKIRDLVIAAIDKKHPGTGFDCDSLHYDGEIELVHTPKQYALQLHFKANWIS